MCLENCNTVTSVTRKKIKKMMKKVVPKFVHRNRNVVSLQ